MNERRSFVIGLVALALAGIVRAAGLFSSGAPSGIDGGNWLAFGSFDRPGLVYPPVVPSLFASLVGVVGPVTATTIAGTLAAIAPGLGLLSVLAWAGHARTGALAALAVVLSGAIGEMAAWGGYPQPIATASGIIALTAAAARLHGAGRASLAVVAIAFTGVVATSHLVALLALAAIGVIIALAAVIDRASLLRAVPVGAIALAPFVLLFPTYATLASLGGQPSAGQAGDLQRILGPAWPAYFAIIIAIPIALVVTHRRPAVAAEVRPRDQALLQAATAAGVTWLMAYALTGEPRLLYDLLVLAFFGAAAVGPVLVSLVRPTGHRELIAAVALAAIVAVSATGMAAFPDQVAYYRILSPDRFDTIQWLAKHAPSQARSIMVADVAGVPIGWWVEGLVRQETVYASDLRWLRFPSERDRARQANAFLYRSDFPTGSSAATAGRNGIAYVFLPSAGAFGIDPRHPPVGWLVVFSSGDAVVMAPSQTANEQHHG